MHVFICYFNSRDTLQKNVLIQNQFDGGEDIEGVEILWRLAVAPNTYSLSMDFVTGLPISTVWKGDNYDLLQTTIDTPRLPDSIISD